MLVDRVGNTRRMTMAESCCDTPDADAGIIMTERSNPNGHGIWLMILRSTR